MKSEAPDNFPRCNNFSEMFVTAAKAWIDDRAPTMGAALSYYTVFSMAPILLIVIAVAGFVFDMETVRAEVFYQLIELVGIEGAQAIDELLHSAHKPAQGIFASIVGVIVMLVGATTVFAELQSSLDHIWRVPARQKRNSLFALIKARILSFGLILAIGFLLTVSLILSAVFAAMEKWWTPYFAGWNHQVFEVINASAGFMLTAFMFTIIYKFIPQIRMSWSDVWMGALITTILFTVGRIFIGFYIVNSGIVSEFGAAGSLIIVLVWVYYSAQIFLYGAEFTWVYAHSRGSRCETG